MDHTIYLTAVFCFYRKAIAVSAHRNNRILQIGAIASVYEGIQCGMYFVIDHMDIPSDRF